MRDLTDSAQAIYRPRKRRTGMRFLGCVIALVIVAATVVPIGLFVVAPLLGVNVFGEDTREVPGDAANFDPIATYNELAAYAQGDAETVGLIMLRAYYVRRDGTLDLTAENYMPRVDLEFVIPVPRPAEAPPVGAGGSADDRYEQKVTVSAWRPGQIRHVTRTGGGVSTSYSYKHLGLEREVDEPRKATTETIPAPTCSFKQLWDVAVERGAPADAVAIITYDDDGYEFNIGDVNVFLNFDTDCRELR
ncbi:MAG: hypothetical protein J5J04_04395 [Anaerolineae bacterium]|jgi:hypothetical protein|nr:MAG: hypothetical protein UZ13_03221 [Chloroflexi bacterium OLB13]MBC6957253.1 hypothetical protein [Chloroflexota bacterium]MBV6436634.1 hypothetical protein [Anaerolineae bacterium]MDL1917257.1 hypothetical protein [Anaerolineae bacterium CFX4]OQY84785.1 MAG: hypothetical protein B6D42_04620 [Anaerolineae bacterium UTCFX5]